MKKLGALIGALVILSQSVGANEEKPVPASIGELREAVAGVLQEHGVPAVGIAMVEGGQETWVGSLGKADLEGDIDADADTMFRIGSVSKMFVALSVLKLVEQGRLSLDDRVADLAPEIEFENPWEKTDPVRVAHLLEHTTGWDDIHLPEYAHSDPTPATLREGLDYHPHSRISRWKPGTRMSYCNAGPPVAAYIVEKRTGMDFEDYVQFNFFDPLGMDTATYRLNDDYRARGATLYSDGEPVDYWHIIMRPSGSINASPRDMEKFLRLFLDRGRVDDWSLVSAASLRRMERSETTSGTRAGLEAGYGLHNYSSAHEHWVYREHGGGVLGGIAEFAYLPEANLGHAIMINSDNGKAFREISRLVRAYETRRLTAEPVEELGDVSKADRAIEGYYYPINPRQQLAFFITRIMNVQKLWFDGDRLAVKALLEDETRHYLVAGDGRYASEKTGRVALVRTDDPLAGEVVHYGSTVLKPVSAFRVYLQFTVLALWGLSIVSSLLFAPVWLIRWRRGKIQPPSAVRVRLWPLLAAVSVAVFVLFMFAGMDDPFKRLSAPTVDSLGVWLASVLLPVFAVLGVACVIRTRNASVNRVVWWHSAASSVLHLAVAAYLWAHDIIGLATWA